MKPVTCFLTLMTALAATLPAQLGGTLIMKDGRRQAAPRILEKGDKYTLVLAHGSIDVPKKLVSRALILDDGAKLPPNATEEEKTKFAKGLVPIEGKWVPRKRAKGIINARMKKQKEALAATQKRSHWHSRGIKETKHFHFEYTLPDEIAQGYMDFFEEYWDVFAKRWRIRQPPKLGKLKVCMYSKEEDFLRIGNVPKGVLGYFRFVEPLELNFFHDRRDPTFTRAVLWHEANHYLMHLYIQDKVHNPGWLEEGLAEYFGGSSYDPKTKKMEPGLIQEGRLVTLRTAMDGGDYQKLDALLRIPRINAIQYGWSWALCHMFFNKKKYTKGFLTYIKKMAKDKRLPKVTYPGNSDFRWVKLEEQIKLFKKCLKIKDLNALEKEWYDYIKSMKVGSARGYYRAAGDCKRWNRPLRAAAYYKKAMEVDPKYLPIYEAYADHLADLGKYSDAKAIVEKGLELDPINPGFYLLLARIAKKSKDMAKAKRLCNLAMDLVPNDVDVRSAAYGLID